MVSQHNCGEVKGRLTIGRWEGIHAVGTARFGAVSSHSPRGGVTDMNEPCFSSLYRPVDQEGISPPLEALVFPQPELDGLLRETD